MISVFQSVTIKERKITAKIDTGAFSSSIDEKLSIELGLLKFDDEKVHTYKSANGTATRKQVIGTILIDGVYRTIVFSVTDRSHLNFPILIGRRDLRGFVIQVEPEEMNPDNPFNITKK
jgi:hypothetical protein